MPLHRASFATTPMGGMGPPKADISRPPDVVTIPLWSERPRRKLCLAGRREIPVKCLYMVGKGSSHLLVAIDLC